MFIFYSSTTKVLFIDFKLKGVQSSYSVLSSYIPRYNVLNYSLVGYILFLRRTHKCKFSWYHSCLRMKVLYLYSFSTSWLELRFLGHCLFLKFGTSIFCVWELSISSVQFSRSVMSYSLRPHESQHARPPCPLPIPRVHSDSRPSELSITREKTEPAWFFPVEDDLLFLKFNN